MHPLPERSGSLTLLSLPAAILLSTLDDAAHFGPSCPLLIPLPDSPGMPNWLFDAPRWKLYRPLRAEGKEGEQDFAQVDLAFSVPI